MVKILQKNVIRLYRCLSGPSYQLLDNKVAMRKIKTQLSVGLRMIKTVISRVETNQTQLSVVLRMNKAE